MSADRLTLGAVIGAAALGWRGGSRVDARLDALNDRIGGVGQRLTAVGTTLALLVKGLHIEVGGQGRLATRQPAK